MQKKVKICGDKFLIKEIKPYDFLGDENNVPIECFKLTKKKTLWDQVKQKIDNQIVNDKKTNEEDLKSIKAIINAGTLKQNRKDFNCELFFKIETDMNKCLQLLASILEISLKKFRYVFELTENDIFLYGFMADKYKKLPIEILFKDNDYTDLDAFLFNRFIFTHMLEKENQEYKKTLQRMKSKKYG